MSVEPLESKETRILRCASFHSVKGGVGKSTLSYLVARLLAGSTEAGGRVALIDADLTGTSLADVLPLRAPRWDDVHVDNPLPLDRRPDSWTTHAHVVTAERPQPSLTARAARKHGYMRDVPLLNDFLLWKEHRYEAEKDVHPEALFWKPLVGDSLAERLVVIPSSALPNDLAQILPLIYDELHAAYLESRLEWLLHWLLNKTDVRTVVFDTPPTIPGLSRAVLSMALRLPDDISLADDGGTPPLLPRAAGTTITWTPFLVVSPDLQDIRAADRWLDGRSTDELARIKTVINRADRSDPGEMLKARLTGDGDATGAPSAYGGALLEAPAVVRDRKGLRLFLGAGEALDREEIEDLAPLAALVRG